MTAYNARSKSRTPKGNNKKDGSTGHKPRDIGNKWIAAGFTWPGPARGVYNYTWKGDFPVFRIGPGYYENEIGLKTGLVAVCKDAGITIFFPYGTNPTEIKARLDDEILAIMKHDAEIAEAPPNWLPDVSEIDFDLWMTRPETAHRQAMPAVKKFAQNNGLTLDEADEMMIERSS